MASKWESRFRNHGLWQILETVEEMLSDAKLPKESEGREALHRLHWIVELLKSHKSADDVRGYTPMMLDAAARPFEGDLFTNLQQYAVDPKTYARSLLAAADSVDNVLDGMANWPSNPRGAAIAAGQAFAAYERSVTKAMSELNDSRTITSEGLSELSSEIQEEREAISTLRADFESTADDSISKAIAEAEDKYLERTADSVDEIRERLERSKVLIQQLEEQSTRGNRLVEAIGKKAVAQDYRTNARNKSFSGWVWDSIGLVIGGASLLLLLRHLFDEGAREVDTSLALTRVAVSIAGVGLAALCFARGRDNHAESRRSKRADIRLSTVTSFVAQQDEEYQDALVQAMADRIYLQDIVDSPDPYDPTLMEKAVEKLRERRAAREDDDEDEV